MYTVYLESIYGMRLNKTALNFFPTVNHSVLHSFVLRCCFSGMPRFSHTRDCVSPLNFFTPHSNSVNVNLYVRCRNSTLIVILVIISSRYDSLSFGFAFCLSQSLLQIHIYARTMCAKIPMCLCQHALSTFHLFHLEKLLRNSSGMMQPFCVTDFRKQRVCVKRRKYNGNYISFKWETFHSVALLTYITS